MSVKKKHGLNRGLEALFREQGVQFDVDGRAGESAGSADASSRWREVPIDLIDANPHQPRKRFAEEDLAELAASVSAHGIVQPLLLRPNPTDRERYEIVAGERRWRAAQRVGLHEVPAVVRDFSDGASLEIALVENLQRADLNPVEEARGYRNLTEAYGRTHEAVGRIVGKSREHVTNTLRLLELPDGVLRLLEGGTLTPGHARQLVGIVDAEALARRIVEEELTVRATEALVRQTRQPNRRRARTRRPRDPDTVELEHGLSVAVGCRVVVNCRNEKGDVRIAFSNLEELDRIAERLSGSPLGDE